MNASPYCQNEKFIEVHGHVQFAKCGSNVDPCCEGAAVESSGEEVDSPTVTVSRKGTNLHKLLADFSLSAKNL